MIKFIKLVTITGSDDNSLVVDLIDLSAKYPFIEWGILLSSEKCGTSRYPSIKWIESLIGKNLRLSCHLCSDLARKFVKNDLSFIEDIKTIWPLFTTVQINCGSFLDEVDVDLLAEAIKQVEFKEFTIQISDPVTNIIEMLKLRQVYAYPFYDNSMGRGILSENYVTANGVSGYGGGLNEFNIKRELRIIQSASNNYPIWIDVETGVRSSNNKYVLPYKVASICEVCKELTL